VHSSQLFPDQFGGNSAFPARDVYIMAHDGGTFGYQVDFG